LVKTKVRQYFFKRGDSKCKVICANCFVSVLKFYMYFEPHQISHIFSFCVSVEHFQIVSAKLFHIFKKMREIRASSPCITSTHRIAANLMLWASYADINCTCDSGMPISAQCCGIYDMKFCRHKAANSGKSGEVILHQEPPHIKIAF
jgi:hypothetical protein